MYVLGPTPAQLGFYNQYNQLYLENNLWTFGWKQIIDFKNIQHLREFRFSKFAVKKWGSNLSLEKNRVKTHSFGVKCSGAQAHRASEKATNHWQLRCRFWIPLHTLKYLIKFTYSEKATKINLPLYKYLTLNLESSAQAHRASEKAANLWQLRIVMQILNSITYFDVFDKVHIFWEGHKN